jgi:hypothetical protein
VHAQELLHERRKRVQAEAVHGGDAQRAAHRLRALAQLLFERVQLLQDGLALSVEQAPRLRRHREAPRAPLDEPAIVPPLERGELLTHGGLRHEIELPGFAEAAGFDQVAERFQGLDVHAPLISKTYLPRYAIECDLSLAFD